MKDKAAMAFLANFIPAYIRYAPGRLKTAVFAGKNLSRVGNTGLSFPAEHLGINPHLLCWDLFPCCADMAVPYGLGMYPVQAKGISRPG